MRVDAFDFELPPERIALEPASPRDSARMLVVGADGALTDSRVSDLPDFLRAGDALVVNDTRVIAARLEGVRVRGEAAASIEATLISRVDDCRWRALVRPAKKLKVGERIRFGETSESHGLSARGARRGGRREGRGGRGPAALRVCGRCARRGDRADRRAAAAALYRGAPRARRKGPGRLSDDVRRRTRGRRGADRGPPFHARSGRAHRRARRLASSRHAACRRRHFSAGEGGGHAAIMRCMRRRARSTPRRPTALNAARRNGGRIVCVGTTSARILESAADEKGRIQPFAGETSIFITPGYRFRAVDVLMTNFHLPRSTLFMLVERVQRPRDDPQSLCARDRSGLSLLLVRRRLPADRRARRGPCCEAIMSDGISFAVSAD